jgi:DNA-binding NtrC family response regulator
VKKFINDIIVAADTNNSELGHMKSTNRRIIGIVDDEIDITGLFEDAIKTSISGFALVSFNDPLIALEHYTKNKKDYVLVISDLKLPNLSGLELLKKVKGLNPKVRTILVSAYEVGENDVFQKYVKEGIINLFISKPVKINDLCQSVSEQIQEFN